MRKLNQNIVYEICFVKNSSVLLSSVEKILIVADLKVVKSEFYCWHLIFYLKIMRDSEHINETVETIDMLIVSAIEQLKKKQETI